MTYAALQTDIADWLNRDDLTSVIPSFITQAEARLNRSLRTDQQIVTATGDTDAKIIDVPDDWAQTIRLSIIAPGYYTLALISHAEMLDNRQYAQGATGIPTKYTHRGRAIELDPAPSGTMTFEIVYYTLIPVLSVSNTTNWLLDDHPDVYLAAAMVEAARYLSDAEMLAVWSQTLAAGVNEIALMSSKSQWSGSNLKLRMRP